MKKLVYLAVVAFAASMVACGNSNKANEEAAQDAVVEEAPAAVEEVAAEVAVDSAAQDTVVAVEATEAVAE